MIKRFVRDPGIARLMISINEVVDDFNYKDTLES